MVPTMVNCFFLIVFAHIILLTLAVRYRSILSSYCTEIREYYSVTFSYCYTIQLIQKFEKRNFAYSTSSNLIYALTSLQKKCFCSFDGETTIRNVELRFDFFFHVTEAAFSELMKTYLPLL